MCRLYGFRSTAPRKIECELIRSQNSFIVQSRHDETGKTNAQGWGLAAYADGRPYIRKQPRPAFASEDFRLTAADVFATNVLAHVRRATIAPATVENTHPFLHEEWTFIHNGEIVAIEEIRPHLLEGMTVPIRAALEGETDSEHVFRYLLSQHEKNRKKPLTEILREGIHAIEEWVERERPGTEIALNILMTNGHQTIGSRLGRSLWFVERKEVHSCEVCGGLLHVDEDPGKNYRAVVIASERFTRSETWSEIPNGSLVYIDPVLNLRIEPIDS